MSRAAKTIDIGPDDVMRMAQNLARNCGYAVFPCRLVGNDKVPTRPKSKGGQGFKDATTDPERIAWLWHNWPGPLIGIATGEGSGISVLDVDRKHPDAVVWWQENFARLLPTRTYETLSGGLHLHFRHVRGVRNSQGKICAGIDTRGEGGYATCWFAAKYGCFDHSPPAPWPAWLLAALTPPAVAQAPPSFARPPDNDRVIAGIVRRVANAAEGERNGLLFWAACRCDERGIQQRQIEALLIPAAMGTGLTEIEARRTINSATGRAAA